MTKINKSTYKKMIKFLPKDMYEFALNDEDTMLDILEQKLDKEEIESIVITNMHYENLDKKQKITISIPKYTLQQLKIQAKKM